MVNVQINLESDTFHPPKLDDPKVTFSYAKEFMEEGDYKNAIIHLKQLVKLSPDNVNFNLALSLNLFFIGKISESVMSFNHTIALDNQYRNTPEFENVMAFKKELFKFPHSYLTGFLQGSHAPERQVFMSAALDTLNPSETTIEILEIGSYAGSSLLTWSNAADRLLSSECCITCIDPWGNSGAELFNDEMAVPLTSNRAYEVFCHNAALSGDNVHIKPIREISEDILPKLEPNKYDLIFIDGSHHYADVLNDIVESKRLLKLGGIICGDDLEVQLGQCDQEFVKINKKTDYVNNPANGKGFHPGVTLAVGEFFGDVSCFSGFWAMRLTSSGFEKISFNEARGVRPNHWPPDFQGRITAYFKQSDELGQLL